MKNIFKPEQEPEIPVYLFTGFLESGKTTFINETLGDERFNAGERTLLILCEEGIEAINAEKSLCKDLFICTINDEEQITTAYLSKLQKQYKAQRILVEYNGMWKIDTFYRAMPKAWMVYQEFCFADSTTFLTYNANMRSLVFDKLQSCELIVFNRTTALTNIMELHKIVRAVNRNCNIAYEATDGTVKFDEIVDPLPFDIDAPTVTIADTDFAVWYRDIGEELQKYDGKTVQFKGLVSLPRELTDNAFIIGRPLLNCCADDITFAGLIAEGNTDKVKDGQWIVLTAQISVRAHEAYDREGPVLVTIDIIPTEAPSEEVASF